MMLTRRLLCIGHYRFRPLRRDLRSQKGQSLVEFALTLPLYGFLILGLGLFAWWWWNSLVVGSAIGDGVRAAAVESGSNAEGNAEMFRDLVASLGGFAEQYHGRYSIADLATWRSVRGSVRFELNWPLLPIRLPVMAGNLQRQERFYAGPPGAWE